MATTTTITFLGTADAVPEAGRDVASFVINGVHLVDAGWSGTAQMIRFGLDPLKIRTIILTHCHQDHYMGLPQFFFYWAQRWQPQMGSPSLLIIGPDDLPMVLEATRTFLLVDRYPRYSWKPDIRVIRPGETIETDDFSLAACQTRHPVDGRCYRFTDRQTGATLAFTGDTAYHDPIADHVRGCDLLLHDATFPHDHPRQDLEHSGHSTAVDAARIAQRAAVRQLILLHYQLNHCDESLARAAQVFPDVSLAREGQTVEVKRLKK